MYCVCGENVGFLSTCVLCKGSCCMYCHEIVYHREKGAKIEICRSCYRTTRELKVTTCNFVIVKSDGTFQCVHPQCKEKPTHYFSPYPCMHPRCIQKITGYCFDHAKKCKMPQCKKIVCADHECCAKHVKECKICHKNTENWERCRHCKIYVCKPCAVSRMPHRLDGFFVCKEHFGLCKHCGEQSCYATCGADKCKNKMLCIAKCDRFGPKPTQMYCRKHQKDCPHCDKTCAIPHMKEILIGTAKGLIGPTCRSRMVLGMSCLIVSARRNGISFPRDIKRLIMRTIINK